MLMVVLLRTDVVVLIVDFVAVIILIVDFVVDFLVDFLGEGGVCGGEATPYNLSNISVSNFFKILATHTQRNTGDKQNTPSFPLLVRPRQL